MFDLFPTHRELKEADYQLLWEKCLFIFDANVLLDLYRLPTSAREDLINLLSDNKIKDRIWIPFQVSLEFIYNRLDVISDQKNKFHTVKKIAAEALNQIDTLYLDVQKKINDLQLKKRHSVINSDAFINSELFKSSIEVLNKFIEDLDGLEKSQPDVNDSDDIGKRVSDIFKGKIGKPFTKADLELLYKEGEARYKDNIPPSYKDASKVGVYMYNDSKYIRKYGDLILWKEIINKCKSEGLEYALLVTGDIKEDWWFEKRGRKLGPRHELLNEIYFNANTLKLFHIYDTSNFMEKAKEYLKLDINQKSIEETKDLIEYHKTKNIRRFLRPLSIGARVKQALENFPTIAANLVGFDAPKKVVKIPREDLAFVLV